MNAPWGIVMAPSDFGQFNHRLLIGQFNPGTDSTVCCILRLYGDDCF
jgi:hypothetical protein